MMKSKSDVCLGYQELIRIVTTCPAILLESRLFMQGINKINTLISYAY